MRDEFGFIDLDQLEKENIIHFKEHRLIAFDYNNQKYFYKKAISMNDIFNELIAEEIAKCLGLPTVHYDLASTEYDIGVISESFYQKGDNCIYLKDILTDCYKEEKSVEPRNNLEDIWYALDQRYKDKMLVAKLMSQLISIFIFDILIGNIDRHSLNLIIIENQEGVNFSKVFDNERMLDHLSIIDCGYALGIDKDDYFEKRSEFKEKENFVQKFINTGSGIYKKLLQENLEIINEENIERILQKVEKRIGVHINHTIKKSLKMRFLVNYETLNSILNSKTDNQGGKTIWKIK